MKTIAKMIFLIPLAALFCSPRFGIERGITPVERPDTEVRRDRCAIIRSVKYEAAAEFLHDADWEKLLKYDVFQKKKEGVSNPRIPRLHFFQVVITNLSEAPLQVESITLKYGDTEQAALTPAEVMKKCASPAYSLFSFEGILSFKKLIAERACSSQINYGKDLIDYRLDFISPGDRVLKIAAFAWIPVEQRDLRIVLALKFPGEKKIVDFDFHRSEYRTRGGQFVKPARKEEKEIEEEQP